MPLEKLKVAQKRTIGTKQTKKAVEKDLVKKVFIAQNADPQVTQEVAHLCKEKGIEVTYVDTMEILGKACGIDVGSASASILKD